MRFGGRGRPPLHGFFLGVELENGGEGRAGFSNEGTGALGRAIWGFKVNFAPALKLLGGGAGGEFAEDSEETGGGVGIVEAVEIDRG